MTKVNGRTVVALALVAAGILGTLSAWFWSSNRPAKPGELKWTQSVGKDGYIVGMRDGAVICWGKRFWGLGKSDLVAFDAASGARRWRRRMGSSEFAPLVDAEGIYARETMIKELASLDPATGSAKAHFALTTSIPYGALRIGEHTICVLGSRSLLAIDTETGAQVWEHRADSVMWHRAAVTDGQRIYFMTGDSGINAVNAQTGKDAWSVTLPGGNQHLSITFALGMLYVMGGNGLLYALDPATGGCAWASEAKFATASGRPVLVVKDEFIYVADSNGCSCVSRLDGSTAWSFPLMRPSSAFGLTVDGDTAYYSSATVVYALNLSTGKEEWRYVTAGYIWGGPSVAGDTVYVCTYNGLCALDAVSGGERWRCPLRGDFQSQPTVSNGIVYCVTRSGKLYAVTAQPEEEKK